MNKFLLLLANVSLLSVVASACNVETHNGAEPGKTDPACASFCLRLYDCGSLGSGSVGDCLDVCDARMSMDENATTNGCQCVADDACRAVSDYKCPGAPFPRQTGSGGASNTGGASSGGVSAGGTYSTGGTGASAGVSSGGSAGASGGSGGTGSGGSASCTVDHDCPLGDDCIGGKCLTRCNASCECAQGVSCVSGYCRVAPPPTTCQTDCECPAGDHCVNGVCG